MAHTCWLVASEMPADAHLSVSVQKREVFAWGIAENRCGKQQGEEEKEERREDDLRVLSSDHCRRRGEKLKRSAAIEQEGSRRGRR
jgi:hypothetical protein